MRSAFLEYLRLLWRHWWRLLIGVGFGTVGAVMDMEIITAPVPSWVWWGLAFGTFSFAQFMSFVTLHKEVTKYRKKPKPEVYLHTVFDKLYDSATQKGEQHPTAFAINSIIERAITGEIIIFGIRNGPPDVATGPQEPIDKSYWKHNKITTDGKLYFGLTQHEKTIRMRTRGPDEIYYSLKADGSQVQICWPQRKQFRIQWPFRREDADVSR